MRIDDGSANGEPEPRATEVVLVAPALEFCKQAFGAARR